MSTIYPINYSFSGADCKAFAEVGNNTFHLQGLSTISISVHEAKSPVRRLGYRGAVAYTKAIRTIAGSMVFVLLNGQHPLQQVIDASKPETPKSKDTKQWSTGINKFNIQLSYATEYVPSTVNFGESIKLNGLNILNKVFTSNIATEYKIKGIHLLNDGFVTSINDLVSEVVIQFTALDIEQMSENKNTLQLSEYSSRILKSWNKHFQNWESEERPDYENDAVEVESVILWDILSSYKKGKPLTMQEVKQIIETETKVYNNYMKRFNEN